MTNFEESWAEFVDKVGERLEKGEAEYEGRSFSKSPNLLLNEIEEELLDITGWSFIMWQRISQLRKHLPDIPVEKETTLRRAVSALETIAAAVKEKLSPSDYTVTAHREPFAPVFASILDTIVKEQDDENGEGE